jgi:hypothetical protein
MNQYIFISIFYNYYQVECGFGIGNFQFLYLFHLTRPSSWNGMGFRKPNCL